MKRRTKPLTAEDRELWERVRRSVKPLKGRPELDRLSDSTLLPDDPGKPGASASPPAAVSPPPAKRPAMQPFLPPYRPPVSSPASAATPLLDDHTVRRLKKGRLEIDARIDLHGMTQDDAHRALRDFLERAWSADMRIVLVITGKGRGGDGILRRAAPLWLAEAPFRRLVGGFRQAHAYHGGEGAIYVRLRRREPRGAGR